MLLMISAMLMVKLCEFINYWTIKPNQHKKHYKNETMTNKHKMTQERWNYLMQPFDGDESVMLTAQELDDGWHWCDEWDGLLIHSDDREFEHCKCDFMKKFRTPERMEKMKQQQALDDKADIDNALGFFGPDDNFGCVL
jgi:hypothetical protein